MRKILKYSTIALSGLLLALSFPKFNLYVFAPFSLVPLFFFLTEVNPLFAGFVWGVPHFILLLYWIPFTIEKYGNLSSFLSWCSLFLLSLYLSIFYAFLFYVIKKARLTKEPSFLKGIVLGLLWSGTEFLRASVFTGLSWGELGYLLSNFLLFLQFADVFGVWGLTLLVVVGNYFVFSLLNLFGRTIRKPLASFVPFILFFLLIACTEPGLKATGQR